MTGLARGNVPAARFVTADATEIEFPPGSFDAIVSFYAIFPIEREGVVGGGFAGVEAAEEIHPIFLAVKGRVRIAWPGTELERRAAIAGRL